MNRIYLQWSALGLWGVLLPCHAEITLDGTMGPRGALSGPDFQIDAAVGRQVGGNLFHSFGLFNVNTGESATFTGPDSIDNILSRVTGGQASTIDGLLRSTIPAVNLFLLNPSGVLFGPNAQLNVQGSFHVSTADFIRLADGVRFNAVPSAEDALLTTAPPAVFGFLGNQPASISFQGSRLTVPEDETFSVIGGDIGITGGSLFRAPSGQVDMASVASAGEVTLGSDTLGTDSFSRLGRIDMTQESTIDVSEADGSVTGAGAVFIRGRQFVMDNSHIFSNTQNGNSKGIDIRLTNDLVMKKGSSIEASTSGPGKGGDLTVKAGRLELKGDAFIDTRTFGPGHGGNLTAEAEDILLGGESLNVFSGLFSGTEGTDPGSGDAGNIAVKAGRLELKGGTIDSSTFGWGNGGSLTVEAEDILLEGEFSKILFSSLSSNAGGTEPDSGDAGNITVKAGHLQLKGLAQITTATVGPGKGGNITVKAGRLELKGGAQMTAGTSGSGNGGSLQVEAESILLEGEGGADLVSGLFTSNRAKDLSSGNVLVGSGDAGNITVKAGRLELKGGGQLGASTFGSGNGGSLTVEAEDIVLEGSASAGFRSGLFTNTQGADPGSGTAGDLTVNVGNLLVSEGATISAETFGPGAGGKLFINATNIDLRDGASILSQSTSENPDAGQSGEISIRASDTFRLFNNSQVSVETAQADAGNINLQVGSLVHLRDQSSITTSVAGGTGDGGDITIDPTFVVLDRGSEIVARAREGHGGAIKIRSNFFFQSPDSRVDASSGNPELSGTVEIDAPDTDIIGGISVLPEAYFDATALLTQACAERFGTDVSSLVARRYEVLPDSPYALRVQLPKTAPDGTGWTAAVCDISAWRHPPLALTCLGR